MQSDWAVDVPNLGEVIFSQELLNSLSKFRQLGFRDQESGGVLIGKYLNSGGAMLIDDFTPPQPTDKQSRCGFYRSAAHNRIVTQAWKESEGHATYVGLWHTHPEPNPNYSSLDRRDWEKALKESQYEGDHLLFVIVGQLSLRCWIGDYSKKTTKISLIGEHHFGN
ncbi:Mov34/MPN/PAD-1 family protein [Vibrio parahaemolyticus]|uniref:Mov34/MPN/PAD-1 family protein n=1 Tax=Vibrio parahaemolyticus TaxID=670 RepID=UPI003B650F45|nr:Mov34/MPN/PAD-1 family protein [Vibrio parahaemolyticus]